MKSFTLSQNISFTRVLALTVVSISLATSLFYQSSTTEGEIEQQQNQISNNIGKASNM